MLENTVLSKEELKLLNETHDVNLKSKIIDNIYSIINGIDIYLIQNILSKISANTSPQLVEKFPVIEFDRNILKFANDVTTENLISGFIHRP